MKTINILVGVAAIGAFIWLIVTAEKGCQARRECELRACPDNHKPLYLKAEGRCVCFVEALVPEG